MNFRVRIKFARAQTGFSKKNSDGTSKNSKQSQKNEANVAMMSAGKVDPYQAEADKGKHGYWRKRLDKGDSLSFVNRKEAEENYMVSRDPFLFFRKNYHNANTGELLIKDAFFLRNDETESLAIAFDDCMIFFDVQSSRKFKTVNFDEPADPAAAEQTPEFDSDTQKAIQRREFLLNPRTTKNAYKVFQLEQFMLWMSKGDYPTVYSQNTHDQKISCFKFWDQALEIIYEKAAAYLLYVLTTNGEVLVVELRPNLCNLKHKVRLPQEILPMTIPVKDGVSGERILPTANMSILDENLMVYSKVSNKVYKFPLVPKPGAPDYNPTSIDAFELLGLTENDLPKSDQDLNFSLNLMKHDEVGSVNFFLMVRTLENSAVEVKSFYVQRRVLTEDDEDFEEDSVNDVNWWVTFMNSMKIPFYFLTIFIVIGANLWWRSKKKADAWSDTDKQKADKYSGMNPNLLGGFKEAPAMNDYDKFGAHEKNVDHAGYGNSDSDEENIPNEKEDFAERKKKIRFSDEVGKTDQMSSQLEGLISSTNALAGQQGKLKEMVDALKR